MYFYGCNPKNRRDAMHCVSTQTITPHLDTIRSVPPRITRCPVTHHFGSPFYNPYSRNALRLYPTITQPHYLMGSAQTQCKYNLYQYQNTYDRRESHTRRKPSPIRPKGVHDKFWQNITSLYLAKTQFIL